MSSRSLEGNSNILGFGLSTLLVIETSDLRKDAMVTFKQIGTLAGQVLLKAERSARRRALRLSGEPISREQPTDSPGALTAPVRESGEVAGTRSSNEKDGARSSASVTLEGKSGEIGQTSSSLHAVNGKIELASTGEPTHRPRAFPPRRVGSPVLVVTDDHDNVALMMRAASSRMVWADARGVPSRSSRPLSQP